MRIHSGVAVSVKIHVVKNDITGSRMGFDPVFDVKGSVRIPVFGGYKVERKPDRQEFLCDIAGHGLLMVAAVE